jgi:hypothetical protein
MPKSWNNITIHPNAEDQTYILSLCNLDDTLQMRILPQLKTHANKKKFEERFKVYLAAQSKRLETEEAAFRKFKTDTTEYYAANGHYMINPVTPEYYVMRQFAIDGFGMWNCDQPQGFPKGAVVAARFVDQDGNSLAPEKVFLVDKARNTVYTYYRNNLDKFSFNPSSKNMVWAIFPGDKIGVIRAKEFREKYSQARGSCVFKFEISPNPVISKEDLKSKLTFDL